MRRPTLPSDAILDRLEAALQTASPRRAVFGLRPSRAHHALTMRQRQILEVLREHEQIHVAPLGLRALARALGLAPATVHQKLQALWRKGVVRHDGGTYRLTSRVTYPGIIVDGPERG